MNPIKQINTRKAIRANARMKKANSEFKLSFCHWWQFRKLYILKKNIKSANAILDNNKPW